MNKQRFTIIHRMVIYFLVCLMFSSCERTFPVENELGVTIRMQVPKPLEVTTKASELDGITISNVWVLQYNTSNPALLKKAAMFTGSDIGDDVSQGVLEVTTTGFYDGESSFYVIANAGTDFISTEELETGATPITEAALKAKTKVIAQATTVQPAFLTAKPVALTVKPESEKAVIVAPLDRTYARVNVEWAQKDLVGKMKITKVEVGNLPKNMAAYSRAGAGLDTQYPDLLDGINTQMKAIIDPSGYPDGWDLGTKQTFYMAENLRGMGTGSTFAEKNKAGKGPGVNGSLEGCTYVLLTGEYTYSGPTAPIGVQYKIYIGGNLTNDYNIQRGYSYDLKVNISGANSADVRVTITDGNVAIFDEVQSITNAVDF